MDIHDINDGRNDCVITPSGTRTNIRVLESDIRPWDTALNAGGEQNMIAIRFNLKSLRIMESGTVCVGSKKNFILFMNHKEKQNETR